MIEKTIERKTFEIGDVTLGDEGSFFVIAGPCVIEDESTTMEVANRLREIGGELDIPIIFKTSFDKANRTSIGSYRGPGLQKGLEIIARVKEVTNLPILSDIHAVSQIESVAKVLDIIQIPAFLCRQTDLILAAARSGLAVNIKKGQFLAPWDMSGVVQKALSCGNHRLILTERGTSFGYNNLVVDMRSLVIMKGLGFPVVFDATHSVQLPGGLGNSSGGQREFVEHLARAAVAAGVDGVFMEVHPRPDSALCDGPNSLPLEDMAGLLRSLKTIHSVVKA